MLRSVTLLTLGTLVAQVATVLVSPLLTRLYSPVDFGILAVLSTILAMFSPVVSLRYEQAVPVAKSEKDADLLVLTGLLASGVLGLLIPILFYVVMSLLHVSGSWGQLGAYTFLLIPALWLVNLLQVLGFWFVRRASFGEVSRANAYRGVGGAVAQAALGSVGAGAAGLMGGYVLGQALGSVRLMRKYLRTSSVKPFALREALNAGVRYRRFPLLSAPAALLNGLGQQLPYLLFAFLYGPVPAGLLMLAQRVTRLPLQLLGQSVGQAYYGDISANSREAVSLDAMRRLSKSYWSTARTLLLVSLPFCLVVIVIGPAAFRVIFGSIWREAGVYAQAMLVAVLAQFITSPMSLTLVALERQELQLVWEGCRLVLVVVSVVLPYLLGSGPLLVLITLSASQALMYLLLFFVTGFVVSSRLRQARAADADDRVNGQPG